MDEMKQRAEQCGRERALKELAGVKAELAEAKAELAEAKAEIVRGVSLAAGSLHGSYNEDFAYWTRELREANERAHVAWMGQRAQCDAELLQVREASAAALARHRDSSAAELLEVRDSCAAELARVGAASKLELERAADATLAMEMRYVNFVRALSGADWPAVLAMQHVMSQRLSYWGRYTGTLPVNTLICMGADVFTSCNPLNPAVAA
jgi:hypothetical protein